MQLKDYERALPELEKAEAGDPSLEPVHRDLGIISADQERNEDAERELKRATELNPEDVSPHWRLARLYQAMGKKEEAKAEFAKASSMNKKAKEALDEKLAGAKASAPQQ